jgi:TetR/AcrR family transcriptional regulator, transcriptional repressor for nem operon
VGPKGSATRQRIVERAAPVFNQRGYWGASMSDLMEATGLEKGGIYNHFGSKESLALEAFDHNTDIVADRIRAALDGTTGTAERLQAVIAAFRTFVEEPPFPGGCPLLNTATESDDTHPVLRDRARTRMTELLDGTVARIVERGVEKGELRRDVDAKQTATVVIAALEGAIMLSRLYDSPGPMRRTAAHLTEWVETLR